MIPADRFLASRHLDEHAWFTVRRMGVTATAVAEVAGKRDRAAAISEWLNPEPFNGNAYTQFGVEQEPAMMRWAHDEHGILPCDWVIRGDSPWHMASPDGLSVDHRSIAEGKTTGDPWEGAESKLTAIPIKYRRQMQWQMHVTGAERCLLVWQLRSEGPAGFFPAWIEPRSVWIDRDEDMIGTLTKVADEMLGAKYV